MRVYLSENYSPRANIQVLADSAFEVDCLIDTGFSGGLLLPITYKKHFKKVKTSLKQEYILGNGRKVEYSLYLVEVKFNGISKQVFALFNRNSDAILGIEFLKGLDMDLNLKENTISLT
mgnify:CR=1 FL=1